MNVEWLIATVAIAVSIALAGTIMFRRVLRGEKPKGPLQKENPFRQELVTLGSTLVVLGIVFNIDSLISYSFMGVGALLLISNAIASIRKKKRQ